MEGDRSGDGFVNARVSTGRGLSQQDYATPRDFIAAIRHRLGIEDFSWDLAASGDNAVCGLYIDELRDGLTVDWAGLGNGWLWLNPPFSDISPWAAKCSLEARRGARIAFLVPASVGSVWYARYLDGKAMILFIRPRLSFDGKNPYPKDCLLALYGWLRLGYECWDWKSQTGMAL